MNTHNFSRLPRYSFYKLITSPFWKYWLLNLNKPN